MKVLFIGGTGLISSAVSQLAIQRGIDLYLLNRGNRNAFVPEGAKVMEGDINNQEEMDVLLENEYFDVVVDWIVFSPEEIERDIRYFTGKTDQYIFISTVATYERPPRHYIFDESTPQDNPVWDYAVNKTACEERLRKEYQENGFPMTIVRPSHTYGKTAIPFAINSAAHPWTLIDRILNGKKIIVPGDGTSLWTITHNTDFAKGLVGLLGEPDAIGEDFHITSDEVKTWDQYLDIIGEVLGKEPKKIHMTSEHISLFLPEMKAPLYGDLANSYVVDNSKIKKFVPDYIATTMFTEGIGQSIAFYRNNPERQTIDEEMNAKMDRAIARYEQFLSTVDRND